MSKIDRALAASPRKEVFSVDVFYPSRHARKIGAQRRNGFAKAGGEGAPAGSHGVRRTTRLAGYICFSPVFACTNQGDGYEKQQDQGDSNQSGACAENRVLSLFVGSEEYQCCR
jgi:hypothetical protein